MIIIKSALNITATYWFNKFFLTEMAYLASRLYNKYLNAPIEFHMQINVAELQRNLITSITTWYGNIVRPSGNLIADVLLTIMIAFLVVYANPFAAIVATIAANGFA